MKKYLTLALASIALAATASTPREELKGKLLRTPEPTVATMPALHHSPQKAEPEHRWVAMGEGKLYDDITGCYFYDPQVASEELAVTVEMDEANEGWYRIVNPWKNHTQLNLVAQNFGTLEQSDDITIVIDASNPDYVRVMETNIGMDDGYGPSTIVSYTELVGVNLGFGPVTQEQADAQAGKLVDGVITFQGRSSLMLHQGNDYYNGVNTDKVTITLPEFESPIDYAVSTICTTKFCPEADGKYHVTFKGDSRMAGVKYITSPEYPEGTAAINALLENLKANGQTVPFDTDCGIDISDATGEEYFIFFYAVDEAGIPGDDEPYYLAFWVPDTDTEGWTSLGMATMTEGLISCLLPNDFEVESYQVELQRNIAKPGLFRIVNPYNPWSQGQNYLVSHEHNHYIYFNADDFSNPYIMESGLGMSLGGYGEVGIRSDYYNMVRQYGTDMLEMFDIYSGGSIVDNVLTFDGTGDIQLFFAGLGQWVYTNLKPNPDYKEGDHWSTQYFGGDFKLDMTGLEIAGIGDITADDAAAPAEYYNLQGIRVRHPEAGNVYICRRGSKVSKIMIK